MRPIAIFVTMVLVIAAARKAKKKFRRKTPKKRTYSLSAFKEIYNTCS
jgi:acyl-CoA reductase-like NAD-dependent aldehyde dehydrogenase